MLIGLYALPVVAARGGRLSYVYALTYTFYMVIFHSLSNLPLSNKLLFGVHARFWMQPNILLLCSLVWDWVSGEYAAKRYFTLLRFEKSGSIFRTRWMAFSAQRLCTSKWRQTTVVWTKQRIFTWVICVRNIGILPKNSFITNYDQQWTASRYLQICEHAREAEDVYTLNLSMMTFEWFHKQRHLYPKLNFIFNGKESTTLPECQQSNINGKKRFLSRVSGQ